MNNSRPKRESLSFGEATIIVSNSECDNGSRTRLTGNRDTQHLERVTQDGRVVCTQGVDFLRLHASALPHRGFVYVHQQTSRSHVLRFSCCSTIC